MIDSIKQRSLPYALAEGGSVTVRRMAWKPACEFLKKLAAHLSGIAGEILAQGGGPPNFAALLPKLPELVKSTEELATHLLEHSTGLTRDQVEKLDLGDALALIDLALQLNTGDDLKNSFAGIGARVTALLPAMKTKTGASSTPSSSIADTAPNTSTPAPSSTSTSS